MTTKKPAVKEIVKKRNFWALAITRFLADPAWGTLSFWMPLYLINVMHLPLKEIAMFAWLPFLAADFGCVAGGFLAKFFMEKMAHDHDQCASL
ncbi:hexuronate transporter [Salmonella enterica subsp. arizonae]|uniref:Hexuronate transporter n=1 Tax=Salmonella enterica subsp. arizonae TaxID=59203 RepID=A0A379RXB6_SALER|nr:hexuronate transporter [Salmonella enterica subsp. arizonae]